MNEPVKKRLIGAVVIAAVGGLALSFVLHDSHPTYPEGASVAYHAAVPPSSQSATTEGANNADSNTHVLILPKKEGSFQKIATSSQGHSLLSSHPEGSSQATCHYEPKTHSTDCDQPDSISSNHMPTHAKPNQQSEELKNLVSLSRPENSPPPAKAPDQEIQNTSADAQRSQLTPKSELEKTPSTTEPAQAPLPAIKKQDKVSVKQSEHYLLRLATFKIKSNAAHLAQRLKTQGLPAYSTLAHAAGTTYYRVVIGPANQGLVNKWKKDLALTEHLQGYVVKK